MASPEHDDQPVVSSSPPPDTGIRIPVSSTWADARMQRVALSACVQTRRFRSCNAPSAAPVPTPSNYAPPMCRPDVGAAGEQRAGGAGASCDHATRTQAGETRSGGTSSALAGRGGTHRVPGRSCGVCTLRLLLQRRQLLGRELLQEERGRSDGRASVSASISARTPDAHSPAVCYSARAPPPARGSSSGSSARSCRSP